MNASSAAGPTIRQGHEPAASTRGCSSRTISQVDGDERMNNIFWIIGVVVVVMVVLGFLGLR
jgi:hypothetical protein